MNMGPTSLRTGANTAQLVKEYNINGIWPDAAEGRIDALLHDALEQKWRNT